MIDTDFPLVGSIVGEILQLSVGLALWGANALVFLYDRMSILEWVALH